MDELLLPAVRHSLQLRLLLCACFVLFGLSMVVGGFITAFGGSKDSAGGFLFAALGGLVVVMFGRTLFELLRTLRSGGLRLTRAGFEYNQHKCAWIDVEDFHHARGGGFGRAATHIRVGYAPGAVLSRDAKTSVALGKLGFFTAPTYIPVGGFDTGGRPLEDILRRWKQSYEFAALVPAEPPVYQGDLPDEPAPPPPDRPKQVGNAVFSVVQFVLAVLSIPFLILCGFETAQGWLIFGLGFVWIAISVFAGYRAYLNVRALR